MTRQRVLTRPDPPRAWLVVDEAALRRPAGGPQVMRCQLDRLIDATCQPNLTLQVLPYAAGAHPAMCGLFYLFRFPAPDLPDIVYGEHLTSAFYLDKPAEVAACIEALDRLSAQAVPASQTAAILRDIRKEY